MHTEVRSQHIQSMTVRQRVIEPVVKLPLSIGSPDCPLAGPAGSATARTTRWPTLRAAVETCEICHKYGDCTAMASAY